MPPSTRRITLGFDGGQTLPLRASDKALKALSAELENGGWHELKTDEGPISLNLSKIVFLRVEDAGQSVGFSAAK